MSQRDSDDSATSPSTAFLDHLVDETNERRAAMPAPVIDEAPLLSGAVAKGLDEAIAELTPVIAEVSEHIHGDPEVAFEEHRSVAFLADLLRAHGVEVQTGIAGVATSFKAETGTSGPTIAILAEYDALPGIGHACGHNVIAAAGVGAFLAARRALEVDGAPAGRVVLIGTPAEEGHSGKEYLARGGAFEGIDAAIMVHGYGQDVADVVWLGRRLLRWTFTGRPAHASAQPFMGRNALDAASLAYQGIGLMRQQMPPTDRVHAVIEEGGTRPSIITERAVMRLYARSKYPDTLKDLSARLDDIARGAALMTGTQVEIEWDQSAPPSLPVRTNQELTRRWVAAERRRGRDPLPAGVLSDSTAASTDFGNVSYRLPGIHPVVQVSSPDVALHTVEFAEAAGSPAGLSAAVDSAYGLASIAVEYLSSPELRQAVAEEFAQAGGALDVEHFFD